MSARERERERRRDKTTTTTTTRKVRKEEERTPGPSDPRATMSSSVLHYRFKTATETNTLRFEGHSLRVFDIKVGREGGREGGRTGGRGNVFTLPAIVYPLLSEKKNEASKKR